MSHELFYTSAPKGVFPGTSGYCTVAVTRDMPAELRQKLEQLSAYDPPFSPLDPKKAALNPVVFGHYRLTVRGKLYHVLSRICPVAEEYTGRTNFFAHHVVLEPDELPAAGPTWLLLRPGFMETRWIGEPRLLESGRVPPRGDAAPTICSNWQKVTGDAGWAGVLANALHDDRTNPIWLVFEPGTDLLTLLAETSSLLVPIDKWQATFTTFFTRVPPDVPCLCRCVLMQSKAIPLADRALGHRIVDLTGKLGVAPPGPFTDAARSGKQPATAESASPQHESRDFPVPRSPGDSATPWPAAPALRRNVARKPAPPALPPVPIIPSHDNSISQQRSWVASLVGFAAGSVIAFGSVVIALACGLLSVSSTAHNQNPPKETVEDESNKKAIDADQNIQQQLRRPQASMESTKELEKRERMPAEKDKAVEKSKVKVDSETSGLKVAAPKQEPKQEPKIESHVQAESNDLTMATVFEPFGSKFVKAVEKCVAERDSEKARRSLKIEVKSWLDGRLKDEAQIQSEVKGIETALSDLESANNQGIRDDKQYQKKRVWQKRIALAQACADFLVPKGGKERDQPKLQNSFKFNCGLHWETIIACKNALKEVIDGERASENPIFREAVAIELRKTDKDPAGQVEPALKRMEKLIRIHETSPWTLWDPEKMASK